jgi:hypothetical protein
MSTMSQEVKRVPVDFDWPLHQTWEGFIKPERFGETPCEACCYEREPSVMDQLFPAPSSGTGYSPHGQYLHDLWYGKARWNPERGWLPFHPERYGSTLLGPDTPAVRRFAERNVAHAPDFYGTGEPAIVREAQRLCGLWNAMWCHHLAQPDVDALVAAGRLMDFTHTWTREDGWQKIEPPVTPAAAQVNEWSLSGMGHDSINASVAVRARCEREGFDAECPACQGYGSLEAYPGQRAEAEAWERSEPPMGDGWQLWETVSAGSPVSPVFATADGLASWMSDLERGDGWMPAETAAKFIEAGWAPTFAGTPEYGLVSGAEAVGMADDGPWS